MPVNVRQQSLLFYCSLICCIWPVLLHRAAAAAGQQRALSLSLPVIDGWISLKTQTRLSYKWSHSISYALEGDSNRSASKPESGNNRTAGLLSIPHRGSALAHIIATANRTVDTAIFGLSGSLRLTNPDPTAVIVVNTLVLECQWGLSLLLPCNPHQHAAQAAVPQHLPAQTVTPSQPVQLASGARRLQQEAQPALLINPGETAQCTVNSLRVPAQWGSDFKQSCRVLATTPTGGVVQSGHFKLDFASADVMAVAADCVRLRMQCEVAGSSRFKTLGAGEQLQRGVLACNRKTVDTHVVVSDASIGVEAATEEGCSESAQLVCTSEVQEVSHSSTEAQQASSRPLGPGSPVTSVFKPIRGAVAIDVESKDCADKAEPPTPPELLPESGEAMAEEEPLPPSPESPSPGKKVSRTRHPKVSLRIDGTYIVSNYTWLVSTSVAPEQLLVYANSTAAAQFSVTALRAPVRPAVPPSYYLDGTITVDNQDHTPIEVTAIYAVLPWGQTAVCKPDDVVLPFRLDPISKTSCTFRLQYELGLKPSSLRAHVHVAGHPKPLKSWPKSFNFERADKSWSAGACALVAMDFTSDAQDVSVTHAGGEAPAFDGVGTEVCDDFVKWDFTVLVTPVGRREGTSMVVAKTVVTPTSLPGADPSSAVGRSAVTVLRVDVQPWPLTDTGPLLRAAGSWRRGGEVPLVSAQGGDEFLFSDRNESIVIRVNV